MITKTLAKLLINEHKYKPITGNVLTLGRQSIRFREEELAAFFQKELGTVVNRGPSTMHDDTNTELGKRYGSVSDKRFFQMFGVDSLSCLDVTEYEGADIIHDLNYPVPEDLHGKFDFIIDGGTFDHLVDARMAFINVVRMLKPGGRVFQWDAASNFTGTPAYYSFGANVFFDFYTANRFADVKVFIANAQKYGGTNDPWELWEYRGFDTVDTRLLRCPARLQQLSIVLAEKAPDSTYEAISIPVAYRPKDQQEVMQSIAEKYQVSARPLPPGNTGLLVSLTDALRSVRPKLASKAFSFAFNRLRIPSARYQIAGWRYVGRL